MTTPKPHYWRADITGLRALAVIPVVLYHAFPDLLPGGFVGVDIFFVISGFLISGILFRQLKLNNKIDYFDFYAKRVRRIFPNLIVLLLAVAVAGWFVLLPSEYSDLGKSIYSSAFFYQNFRLLKTIGDYFAPNVIETPLLHLWSLAIEEQFHIVFPLLCWAVWKLRKGTAGIGFLVFGITTASLVGCLLVRDQTFNFYFPLTRFWELGAGILLAYATEFWNFHSNRLTSAATNSMSIIGFCMIACAYVFFDHATVFPGISTLLPVGGAMLMIAAGSEAVVNRWLTLKPVVFIGLISYSLYLWHWPFISFLNITIDEPTVLQTICAVAASFLVAAATYVWVENPIRRMSAGILGKRVVAGLACALLACVAVGQTLRFTKGLPDRPVAFVQMIGDADKDWSYNEDLMDFNINGIPLKKTRDGKPEILFIGDSHIEQYAPRVARLARTSGIGGVFLTKRGCLTSPAVLGQINLSRTESCRQFGRQLDILLGTKKFRKIVYANMFGRYLHEDSLVSIDGQNTIPLDEGGFDFAINSLFVKINGDPIAEYVYVILDLPWMDDWKNQFHIKNRMFFNKLPSIDGTVNSHWREGNEMVSMIGRAYPKIKIIDPVKDVCPSFACPSYMYQDDNHLRSSYVRDHALWIDHIFQK